MTPTGYSLTFQAKIKAKGLGPALSYLYLGAYFVSSNDGEIENPGIPVVSHYVKWKEEEQKRGKEKRERR